jgi:hypothetical protein
MQVQDIEINELVQVFYFRYAIFAEHEDPQVQQIAKTTDALDLIVIKVQEYQITQMIQILYGLNEIVLEIDEFQLVFAVECWTHNQLLPWKFEVNTSKTTTIGLDHDPRLCPMFCIPIQNQLIRIH